MPKRAGHLYEEMCEQRNIKLAILDAARGKHSRKDVRNVLEHIDDYAAQNSFAKISGGIHKPVRRAGALQCLLVPTKN